MNNEQTINPIFTTLSDQLNEQDQQIQNINTNNQPYQGDWIPINFSLVSYNNASHVNISGFTPSAIFSVGSKIKLVQASTTKYFYVIGYTSTTITITAGSTYTFTNDPITEFYYSNIDVPNGFPQYFSWTPTISVAGGTGTITPTTTKYNFVLRGSIVMIFFAVQFNVTLSPTIMGITNLPVQASSNYTTLDMRNCMVADSGFVTGAVWFQGTNSVWAFKVGGAAFASGATISFEMSYQIDNNT